MPYGYYQFVRYFAFAGFAILAYLSYSDGKEKLALAYLLLAILFQPFAKIALSRTIWNVVDLAVGIWLIFTAEGFKGFLRK
jgi:hypothetical protein